MKIFGFPTGPLQTNCYVATGYAELEGTPTPCVLVDPGMGAFDTLVAELEARNWKPEAVVLTHGHIDHIRDVTAVMRHWDIPVYIHTDDKMLLENPVIAAGANLGQVFKVMEMDAPAEINAFSHDDEIKFGGLSMQVLHSPGHSPGCVMLRTSDGEDEVVFTGDVLFAGAVGRVDLPGSSPEAMEESLRTRVLPLSDDLLILPGHGGSSTIGAEKETNPFLTNLR